MGKRTIGLFAVLFALGWLCVWAGPALALFPPARAGLSAVVEGDTARYWVQDPISGRMKDDSWTLDKGDERLIGTPPLDLGTMASRQWGRSRQYAGRPGDSRPIR